MGCLQKSSSDCIQKRVKIPRSLGNRTLALLIFATLIIFQAIPGYCQNWPATTVSMLPDSSFALVGKDENGAKKRFCPHHDLNGGLDYDQLIYVLGTFNQVNWPDAQTKAQAQKHLRKHYKALKAQLKRQKLEDPLNINTAGLVDLVRLPNIGPSLAVRIVKYRKQKPFKEIEEIQEVSGIGGGTFNAIRHYIKVVGK